MKWTSVVLLSAFLSGFSFAVAAKERLILLPPGGVTDQTLSHIYRTALSEALSQQYEVLSGTQVDKKLDELFAEESRKAECSGEACYKAMVLAFQAERVAIAQVKKLAEGYLLSLQINNLLENKQEYSKTLPCRQCDEFDVQATLKKLVPMSAVLPPVVLPIVPVAPVAARHRNTVFSARPAAEKAPQVLVADTLPKQRGRVGKRATIAGMPFVWVSPGCFKMGLQKEPKRRVCGHGFLVGRNRSDAGTLATDDGR